MQNPNVGDLNTDIQDIVNALKTLDADVIGKIKAMVNGLRMGEDAAAALLQLAAIYNDVLAAAKTIEADVNADIPANIKAFLAGTAALFTEAVFPFVNVPVTNITVLKSAADIAAAVAAGTLNLVPPVTP